LPGDTEQHGGGLQLARGRELEADVDGYSAVAGGQNQMTTVVHTPVALQPDATSRGWTTPRRLRVASIAFVIVAVAAGVVGGVAMLSRQRAVNTAVSSTEPLVVDAQTVDVALSDADTTIAGGFLAGPVIPAAVQTRFDQDMAQAASALTAASQRAGTGSAISQQLTTLTSGMAIYQQTIATAEADNRLGFPVATAYLAEANNLLRTELLPAASAVYATEQARLSHDDARADSSTLVVVVLILLGLVVVAALLMHAGISRRFRRVINPGLAAAIVIVVAVGVWAAIAAAASGRAVAAAEHRGTAPLTLLTRARILAQQARADDELTLVTRDSDQSYQKDYATTSASLNALVQTPRHGWTASQNANFYAATSAMATYVQEHGTIRSLDQDGQLLSAISTDRSEAAATAAQVDAPLSAGVNAAVTSFAHNDRTASNDLTGLALGCVVLMGIAAIAVLAGVEPRIREYR
jgi:hypothetical protein